MNCWHWARFALDCALILAAIGFVVFVVGSLASLAP